jgi:hypothetical protein
MNIFFGVLMILSGMLLICWPSSVGLKQSTPEIESPTGSPGPQDLISAARAVRGGGAANNTKVDWVVDGPSAVWLYEFGPVRIFDEFDTPIPQAKKYRIKGTVFNVDDRHVSLRAASIEPVIEN